MLKELIDDVKFEVCRKSYLDKVARMGQADVEVGLLGYPVISPNKIRKFLASHINSIVGKEVNVAHIIFFPYEKQNGREISPDAYYKWLGDSVGIYVDAKDAQDVFIALREVRFEQYDKLIPEFCLDKALLAKQTGFFDYFTVGYPEHAFGQDKDPVIFGRRNGSENRFFIAQWDNDITLDDLL